MKESVFRAAGIAAIAAFLLTGCGSEDGEIAVSVTATASANYYLETPEPENGSVSRSNLGRDGAYSYGEEVEVTATPKPGYRFSNWSGAAEDRIPQLTVVMDANKTLIAAFEQVPYTLSTAVLPVDTAGTVTRAPEKTDYFYDDIVTVTAAPRQGYTFVGWEDSAGARVSAANPLAITINGDITRNARFAPKRYTLAVTAKDSGAVSRAPEKADYAHDTAVTVTAAAKTGYKFAGWYNNADALITEENRLTITITRDTALYAKFVEERYTLTTMAGLEGGGSIVSRTPDRTDYSYGEKVTVVAAADEGYRFSHWVGASAQPIQFTTTAEVVMEHDKILIANFSPSPFMLDVRVGPDSAYGRVFRSPEPRNPNPDLPPLYLYGDTVTVTVAANTGYRFIGWSEGESGDITNTDPVVIVRITGAHRLTAIFEPIPYTLTAGVGQGGGGAVSRNPSKATYTYGDEVIVTAAPAQGYSFIGWSGDITGADPEITVKITGSVALTANFVESPYILTIPAADGGTVSRNPSKASYTYGEAVTLTAAPDANYTFKGWAGEPAVTTNPITVTMTGDTTFTAIFEPGTYTLTIIADPAVGGSTSPAAAVTGKHYGETVSVTAAPADGYMFIGWSGASSSTDKTVEITITGNDTLTANFATDLKVPGSTLRGKLRWLRENVKSSHTTYILEMVGNETVFRDSLGDTKELKYSDLTDITIKLIGVGGGSNISLSNYDTDTTSALFTVGSGVTFILDNNITVTGVSFNKNALIAVESGGVFEMKGGSVTGNNNDQDPNYTHFGSGVYVGASGRFTMSGGTISNNRTSSGGGGVYVAYTGTFGMSGGTISGNSADEGGGVFAHGEFSMTGGNIQGNTAAMHGGGVYAGGTFNKTGGTITGTGGTSPNVVTDATAKGAAVYVSYDRYRTGTAGTAVGLSNNSPAGWDVIP